MNKLKQSQKKLKCITIDEVCSFPSDMIKLKAYDKYHKQWLHIIIGEEDEMWDWISSSNDGVKIKQIITFQAIDGDADCCDPKRWSDLEKISII